MLKSSTRSALALAAAILAFAAFRTWKTVRGRTPEPPVASARAEHPLFEVKFPEVVRAAENDPARFTAVARQHAEGDPARLVEFAEMGVNAGRLAEARPLLSDALAAAVSFNQCFHAMRLAFKCGDRELAETARAEAARFADSDFLRGKLQHFHDLYEKRLP